MNNRFKRFIVVIFGLGVALIAGGLTASPAIADPGDDYGFGVTEAERAYCLANFADCAVASDVEQWAKGVSGARYTTAELNDGVGDAFRHCILAGALTQRLGPSRATTLLNVHELDSGQSDASAVMDYSMSMAMRKYPLVARSRSPLVAR